MTEKDGVESIYETIEKIRGQTDRLIMVRVEILDHLMFTIEFYSTCRGEYPYLAEMIKASRGPTERAKGEHTDVRVMVREVSNRISREDATKRHLIRVPLKTHG